MMKSGVVQVAGSIMGAAMLMAAGCIDTTTTVEVKKDGSGKINEVIYLSQAMAGMMEGMQADMQNAFGSTNKQTTPPPNPLLNKAQYVAKAKEMGEGVTFVSMKEVKNSKGASGVQVEYAFTDVRKIKLSMNSQGDSEMGGGPSAGFESEQAPKKEKQPITFDFVKGANSKLTIMMPRETNAVAKTAPAATPAPESPADPMATAMMKNMLADMHFATIIKVDGEIVKTGAAHVITDPVSKKKTGVKLMDVEFGKLTDEKTMAKLSALQNASDAVVMKELSTIAGLAVEPAQKVEIEFK